MLSAAASFAAKHPPSARIAADPRIDCKELGNETLPVFVPEIRKFAQDNLGKVGITWERWDNLVRFVIVLTRNRPWFF